MLFFIILCVKISFISDKFINNPTNELLHSTDILLEYLVGLCIVTDVGAVTVTVSCKSMMNLHFQLLCVVRAITSISSSILLFSSAEIKSNRNFTSLFLPALINQRQPFVGNAMKKWHEQVISIYHSLINLFDVYKYVSKISHFVS